MACYHLKKIFSAYLLTIAFFSTTASADVIVHLGAFDATQGEAQNINVNGLIGDYFSVTQSHSQNAIIGLGYYLHGLEKTQYRLLYGIDAFYMPRTTVGGNVMQEQLFNNLSYNYNLTNTPIYAATRLLIPIPHNNNLVVDMGVGPNIIRASNFQEYPLNDITQPDHLFNSHTSVAFSATAGVGLQFPHVFAKFPAELSYRFFYLGSGQLQNANSQVLNNFKTGNSYANALIFSVAF